jgi:flavorubredoxin
MLPIEIRPEIYWIGVNDRSIDLFEGLWPIRQEGVSLNSYLILDEKKAIVDLTHEVTTADMLGQLSHFASFNDIDYVVVNHMEPDHTGALLTLRRISPKVKILCTERAKKMLADFYGITDGVEAVKDGQMLSLGRRTLQFVSTPNVHWPETMMTYIPEEKILFSCDGFGGYGALEGVLFDDEAVDIEFYEREALRYYSNIVAGFSRMVINAIKKLENTPVSVIAPSHGLVWRKDPQRIVSLYKQWAEYGESGGKQGITLLYGSMYGNTARLAEAVARGVQSEGVPYTTFDVARTHVSYILPSLWTNAGVLVGAPTYEGRMFPPMMEVLNMAVIKKARLKKVARFGSYGWGGGAQKAFETILPELQWESKGAMDFMGSPSNDDLAAGQKFGADFARAIKEGQS